MSEDRPISKEILLVCATVMEMRGIIRLFPDGLLSHCPVCENSVSIAFDPLSLPRLELPDTRKTGLAIRLLVCGVGPVAAGISIARALARTGAGNASSYAGVINMGLAGSYDPEAAPVGSLFLASEELFPEYGAWPESDEKVESRDDIAPGNPAPLRFCQAVAPWGQVFSRITLQGHKALGNMGLSCHSALRQAPSATVSGVSGTKKRAGRMAALTGAVTENMEGFALAFGTLSAGLHFAEIRAVSNVAGYRPPHTWDIEKAMQALAEAAVTLFSMKS